MGDAGSQFLGLMLAVFPLMLLTEPSVTGNNVNLVAASCVVLAIPIFELVYTPSIRILTGKPPWVGSKDHFPLRAFAMGYSVRRIVLTTYAFGALFSLLGVLQLYLPWIGNGMTLLAILSGASFVALWLGRVRVPKRVRAQQERET
jgi:UDP-GlcNAc:undecaprenyl-phosphate GlcNAc-1-phosphate transferase